MPAEPAARPSLHRNLGFHLGSFPLCVNFLQCTCQEQGRSLKGVMTSLCMCFRLLQQEHMPVLLGEGVFFISV